MVAENEQFWFLVTHVEADNHLLKIWAQTDETIAQSVDSMLLPLQDKFDQYGPNISSNNIAPHTRCCARGNNNQFLRARILNTRSDGMILVQFIDYGNITYVPYINIRLLDGLSEANYLFSVPEAATCFILADVTPIGGTWLDNIFKNIRKILVGNKFYGVYKNVLNYKTIEFIVMEEDFGKLLIQRNMAIFSPSAANIQKTMVTSMPVQPLRTPHTNVPPSNWRMSISQNYPPPPKVVKSNSFKAIQLEIGSVHDVQISFVEEGPWKFSVQLIESIPYLNQMMEKINSQKHLPLQEAPIAGTVCLGRHTRLNKLCRVVLNSPGDTSCKAYFADYGHHEVLQFKDIYQIPEPFTVPNIFSIRFTLSDIMNWTPCQEVKDYFGGLIQDQNLKLRVCKGPMSPLTQYCELFLQGKNIKDILCENFPDTCEPAYPAPKQLQNGTREIVIVPFVESITKFFVQIENDLKVLYQVMDQIEQISNSVPRLNPAHIHANKPCIALYDVDKKWYRASVISMVDNANARVFYVDYGNEEIVSVNNLRAIPSELVTALPKQAIKCSLNVDLNIRKNGTDNELTKYFESLVLEERLNLAVINTANDTLIVNLFDANNIPDAARKNISEIVLKALETSKQQTPAPVDRNTESSFRPLQVKTQKSDAKSQVSSVQKQKTKNKNPKKRDNGSGNWERENAQGQSYNKNNNNYDHSETMKMKFRKDNENEQRHDNRFRKGSSDYSNRYDNGKPERYNQNDKLNKSDPHGSSGSSNDRFNKGNQRNNSFDKNDFHAGRNGKENQNNRGGVNSRLDRSFGSDKASDKDSDTSSQRSGGRRSNRGGRRNIDDQRKRDGPQNNHNRIGRWENEDRERDSYRKNNGTNFKSKSSAENSFDKSRSSDWDTSTRMSPSNSKNSMRCATSTPIPKIPSPNITVGAVKKCIIVFYNNPSSFYVQLCPDNEELHVMMEKISSMYENGGKVLQPSEITKDLPCIAQYSADMQWYRAVVKSVANGAATVHFVDYGNVETVSFDKIKAIEPEFLKLAAQVIHCKLFCPLKSGWTKEESDTLANEVENLVLEGEFVAEDNGVYDVLFKDTHSNKCINDKFANGLDLTKEKEAIRSKTRVPVGREASIPPDYAPLDKKWVDNEFEMGTQYDVFLPWFINPENFYCSLVSQQKDFRDMMNEIQITYAKRQPVSEPLKVGSSVIAVLPEDGVLYRAEVIELNKERGHVVQFIDYGDRAMVNPRKIYPVEKKFMTLPRQAIFGALKNVAPLPGSTWSANPDNYKIGNMDKFKCVFHELKNGKYLTSLISSDGADVSSALVERKLAVFSSTIEDDITSHVPEDVTDIKEVPRIDIPLLEGQTLQVRVSSVEMVNKFYVQFYTAEACQAVVDTYMATKNSEMIGLPGQLSLMQNQAQECALFDVPLSSKANETLKKTVTGKDVKIFVESVEHNRLIVRLFDLSGNKIKVVETQNTEKISPICNLPILSSTHDVVVPWINNSTSLWLQRISDSALEQQFLESLFEHYSKKEEEQIVPEVNNFYAALSSDGNWYRVKVIELKDSIATILLIDYGNIEDISVENIRTLEPQFYVLHQLGIEVSLTVTLNGSNVTQAEVLEPFVKGKVFTATFYNVNRKWVVELTENGEKLSEKLQASQDIVKETTKPQIEYVELPEMVVGEKYNVIVSHVDAPNDLWLQRTEEVNTLRDLQTQLQEAAENCQDYTDIPENKSLCLAMFSLDNFWYRAEVLDADNEITSVRFIDYGNVDVVQNGNGHLKQLPDKWKAIKKYAIQCTLDVIPTISTEWVEEACTKVKDFVATDDLQALIIADKAPMRIDLFHDEQSLCKILVDENLASYIHGSEQLDNELVIEEIELDPRSAYVSYVISVDHFYVQEEKWVCDLEMMEDRLMMANIFPSVNKVEEGLLCIAHFPDDNLYYRATVLSHGEEGTKVHYIDYGNSAVSKDIKTIPEDLAKRPSLVRKCALAKPDGVDHWPSNINEEFKKFSAQGATIFLLDVIEEKDTISLVKLTYDSKDVAMTLLESCKKKNLTEDEGIVMDNSKHIATQERPSPIGEENLSNTEPICAVSYANSPSEFWIHDKSHYSDLDALMHRMYDAENFEAVSEIEEGKILASKFSEDGLWYRSKILSHGESGTEVLYIDYGNAAIAKSETDLRELPDDLIKMPAIAIYCSLKMPEGVEHWSKSACEKFIELIANGSTEFQFDLLDESDSNQPTHVTLYYNNKDVVQILLSQDEILKAPSNNESTEQELTNSKDRNSSGDSAIHSESEPRLINANEKIQILSVSEEILEDKTLDCNEVIVREETVISELSEEIEKSDNNLEENFKMTELIETLTDVAKSSEHKSSLDEEKIVPGSISRGISDEEISRFSPTHKCSSPEEKIVPGSINQGKELDFDSQVFENESYENVTDTIANENLEIENINRSATASPSINHDDRVVPSCISRGETPIDFERPITPKISHSEKILAGSVNAKLVYEDDIILIKNNIPESQE